MLEDDPIDQGDIWKGISHDQVVCVKILGPYHQMLTQPLFKVMVLLFQCQISAQNLESVFFTGSAIMGKLSYLNILPFYGI